MGYINYNPNPARKLVDDCVIPERRGRSARTGRYVSRDSEKERMIGKLEDMMDNVSSEKERRALQQCIDKLEQQ